MKNSTSKVLGLALTGAAIITGSANAATFVNAASVTGVMTSGGVSSYYGNPYGANHLLSGIGLSDASAVADGATYTVGATLPTFSSIPQSAYATGGEGRWVTHLTDTATFTLGGTKTLTGLAIWNVNTALASAWDAKSITLTFWNGGSQVGSSLPLVLATGINNDTQAAAGQYFSFGSTQIAADSVQITLNSNYSDGSDPISGLGQVRFIAVPEPSASALLLGSLSVLTLTRRRKTA
jgi:hypothetical protein